MKGNSREQGKMVENLFVRLVLKVKTNKVKKRRSCKQFFRYLFRTLIRLKAGQTKEERPIELLTSSTGVLSML